MMIQKIRSLALSLFVALICIPTVHAYLTPYEVLLSNDLLLPPQPRMSAERADRQQRESAARRDEEQAAIFAEQHPAAIELLEAEDTSADGTLHDAAPAEDAVSAEMPGSLEFSTLMRTLERIKENQTQAKLDAEIRDKAFLLLQENGIELHDGAPLLPGRGNGLAPTGAGTILAFFAALAGIVWTVSRAYRSSKLTRIRS